MARFRYFRFDEALIRDLAEFQNVLDLFNHLLVQSGGDVEEALDMLRYLKQHGYLPETFDVDAFAKRLVEEELIEISSEGAKLTRKGERGIRKSALTYVFSALRKGEAGDHRVPREGEGREMLSEKRPWRFGDEVQNIDFMGSLLNSYRRAGADGLSEDDLEVFETEHASSCATALLIDISHSMILYGEDRITPAKRVALALTELILTKYPKDTLDVIAFGDEAFEIAISDIPYLEVGPFHTNTKAALQMARKILERRKATNRQIFLITDGKPTVIRESDGAIYRNTFGLDPKIINRTLDEAVVCRRKRIPITTFMVTRDPYFQDFVTQLTELNRGRAYFSALLNKLGEYILMDFVENRAPAGALALVSASARDHRSPAGRRTLLLGFISFVGVAILTLVLAEIAARFYTYRVLQREPRYETDAKLGWRMRPHLATRRRLSESYAYALFTDGRGHRIAEGEPGDVVERWRASAGPRILVLGDSFAEGFVNIEQRFDRVLAAHRPEWAILTLGCGGYSVDQEMIAGREFFEDLRAGDVLLLLTCGNDFEEMLTQSYSARARPYFTLEDGRLTEHRPAIGLRERIRDASYVASVVLLRASKSQTSFTPEEREHARRLYAAIVRAETGTLVERGVRVVIAHHTDWLGGDNADAFRAACDERAIFELALDPHVIGDPRDRNPNLLEDGTHWTARGNAAAAAALEPFLARLLTNP